MWRVSNSAGLRTSSTVTASESLIQSMTVAGSTSVGAEAAEEAEPGRLGVILSHVDLLTREPKAATPADLDARTKPCNLATLRPRLGE